LSLTTTVQPHDKGHQKVNIHKIGVTVVMNRLLFLTLWRPAGFRDFRKKNA